VQHLVKRGAREVDGRVEITLPSGEVVFAGARGIDEALSAALGQVVRLVDHPPGQASFEEQASGGDARAQPLAVAAPPGTFFDFAPVHLLTTGSLARLRELAPAATFDLRRFRPNVVVATPGAAAFVENDWLGRTLRLGDELELCVVSTCPRCVMTTLAQGELPHDPEILRVIAAHNAQLFELLGRKLPSIGVYATVVRPGTIAVGERASLGPRARLRRVGALLRAVKRAVVR
jgi:uncharacterized protein